MKAAVSPACNVPPEIVGVAAALVVPSKTLVFVAAVWCIAWVYLQSWEARRTIMYQQRDVTRSTMLEAKQDIVLLPTVKLLPFADLDLIRKRGAAGRRLIVDRLRTTKESGNRARNHRWRWIMSFSNVLPPG